MYNLIIKLAYMIIDIISKFLYFIVLLLLSPVIIIILFVSFIETKSFPIIKQKRSISLHSDPLYIYKIRTLKSTYNFYKDNKTINSVFENENLQVHVPYFCSFLRRSGLDEILQIINIIKGEMNLIGPRPFILCDLINIDKSNKEFNKLRAKFKSKPGITGYWQVFGDRSKGLQNLIDFDFYFEKEKSFYLNVKIIFATILKVISFSHSDSIIKSTNTSKINSVIEFNFTKN